MKKILILFAHPRYEQSRTNHALLQGVADLAEVTFHDLYERYPEFHIDVAHEKSLLEQHDIIIWHHPFYWYSCPPLLKQWIDVVLEFNWAYGPGGNALTGKTCLQVITTGGDSEVYCSAGRNHYSINTFLRPFEQTARLCGMKYLPPYAVTGTYKLSDEELSKHARDYQRILLSLRDNASVADLKDCEFQDDIPATTKIPTT